MSSQTTNFIKRLRSTRALGRVEVSQPPLFFFFCFSLYDLAVFFYLLSSKLSYTQKHPSFLLLLFFFSPSSSFLSSFFCKVFEFLPLRSCCTTGYALYVSRTHFRSISLSCCRSALLLPSQVEARLYVAKERRETTNNNTNNNNKKERTKEKSRAHPCRVDTRVSTAVSASPECFFFPSLCLKVNGKKQRLRLKIRL